MKARVTVSIEVDLEKAEVAERLLSASCFLVQFKNMGEDWRREVQGDQSLDSFVTVGVTSTGLN